jgi:hypothetical protein
VNVPEELNVWIRYPPDVVIVPPVGVAVTVLLIPLLEGVPSWLRIDTEIVSPIVCPYTAAGTDTEADPEVTVMFATSATVEPPSERRTVTVPVALVRLNVRVEDTPE